MYKTPALLFIACFIWACHKNPHRELSHDKVITSFGIKLKDSSYYKGVIRNDSIFVKVAHAAHLDSLLARVDYKGKSITPSPSTTFDFSGPVVFTVTAEDGTAKAYTVLVSNFTSVKEITAFTLKAAENNGLQSDVEGVIQGNLISVALPSGADITKLKPSITYEGETISPPDEALADFTNGITYTVTADDKTTQTYTVLVSYNKLVFTASAGGYVYALSAVSGKVQWKYKAHSPMSHAIYKDGIVYIGSSDGTFYALDGETGNVKWKFFDQAISYSAPMVAPGVIYVSYYTLRKTTGVYAIDSRTGSLIWKKRIGNTAISAPTLAGSVLYVTDNDYGLCALDAGTGDRRWNYYPGLSISNPAVSNGTVYLSAETGALVAVDAVTGAFKWRSLGSLNIQCAPSVLNGIVYLAAGLNIYAINGDNGSLVWNTTITYANFAGFSSPVISEGVIFAANYNGYVFAFDLASGQQKWSYNNSDGKSLGWPPGPVAAHGMVVTDRGDNVLTAFAAATGTILWKFSGDAQLTYPCMVDTGGNAYYTSTSGM